MNRMSQDEWIASRTNTPDRLGKEIWNNAYKQFRNRDLNGTEPKISYETQVEMLRDFLKKYGCEAEGADNNIVRDGMLGLIGIIDKDFEQTNISPKQVQSLYSQLKNLKGSAVQTAQSPSKKYSSDIGRD